MVRISFKLIGINAGGLIEIRSGSQEGKLLGKATASGKGNKEISATLHDASWQDLYFVFKTDEEDWKTMFELDWIYFHQAHGFRLVGLVKKKKMQSSFH